MSASAGERYGRWTVLADAASYRSKVPCRCECGTEKLVDVGNLRRGLSRSCGCLVREWASGGLQRVRGGRRHGHAGHPQSPTYRSWAAMQKRCHQPATNGYEHYGGRGVRVCDRWRGRGGFERFLADMGERPTGTRLHRLDHDGDYEPSNCRWTAPAEEAQARGVDGRYQHG